MFCINQLKSNGKSFFDSTIMLRFGETKKPNKYLIIFDVNVDKIVTSNLIEKKNISQYKSGFLDVIIRPLVLILPKMSVYVKTFKEKW